MRGATDAQQPIPECLTGRIYSQQNLQKKITHTMPMNTILPIPEPGGPQKKTNWRASKSRQRTTMHDDPTCHDHLNDIRREDRKL